MATFPSHLHDYITAVARIIVSALFAGLLSAPTLARDTSTNLHPTPAPQQYVTQKEYLDLLKAVLDTARDNNEHLKTTITLGGTVAGGVVALLAFLGFREIKSVTTPFKERIQKLEADFKERTLSIEGSFKERMQELQGSYSSKINDISNKFDAKLENDVKALQEIIYAVNLYDMADRNTKTNNNEAQTLYDGALIHLDKALVKVDGDKETTLVAWIHAHRAYVLKRLNRIEDAYTAIKISIDVLEKHREDIASQAFNASCYAGLLNKKEECLSWLQKAVELDPINARDAQEDSDLEAYRSDPKFVDIIRSANLSNKR